MSDITQARKELVARILEGDGRASRAQRCAAFDNAGVAEPLARLIDKVAKQAYKVTDEDIAAARASGLTEPRWWTEAARPAGRTDHQLRERKLRR
jgi:hypothetical protein